jgi:predicted ferric reductase
MHIKKSHIGLVVIIALAVIPIVLWSLMEPLGQRFESNIAILTSIGQISALLGTAMFALSLMLISRLKLLEPYFGGLDRVFHAHRHLGGIGFMLILVHPLVLAARLVPISVSDAALYLLPSATDLPKTLGIISLLIMMALIVITFYFAWKYQHMLAAHKLLGIGFMLGALHGFLMPSDMGSNLILAIYMATLVLVGTGVYSYRTVFKQLVPKHHFMVKEVRRLADNVTEVTLEPTGDPLNFIPGQFIFVSFKNSQVSSEPHPFSISSSPQETNLRLTVKALGDFTSTLSNLEKGTAAVVEGAFGGFTEERSVAEAEVWIAGGIGVTPFLSRARALAASGDCSKIIDFFYTANTPEEMLFLEEFEALAKTCRNFRIHPHPSKSKGLLSAAVVAEAAGPLQKHDIFVCGPPRMMASLIDQCKSLGVKSSHIHREEFSMF